MRLGHGAFVRVQVVIRVPQVVLDTVLRQGTSRTLAITKICRYRRTTSFVGSRWIHGLSNTRN
jgi:hypothetical protein